MKQIIATDKAPAAIGPYSQGTAANGFIFTSGQLPIDPATGAFVPGGIAEQTRQSLMNLKAVLEAGGSSLDKVLKTTEFLSDMNNFAEMNKVYSEFFPLVQNKRQKPPRRKRPKAHRRYRLKHSQPIIGNIFPLTTTVPCN